MTRRSLPRPQPWGPEVVLAFLKEEDPATSLADWLRGLARTCGISVAALRQDIHRWKTRVPDFSDDYTWLLSNRKGGTRGAGGGRKGTIASNSQKKFDWYCAYLDSGGNVVAACREVDLDQSSVYEMLRPGHPRADEELIRLRELADAELGDEAHGIFFRSLRGAFEEGQFKTAMDGAARFLETKHEDWGRKTSVTVKGEIGVKVEYDPESLVSAATTIQELFSFGSKALPDPGPVIELTATPVNAEILLDE